MRSRPMAWTLAGLVLLALFAGVTLAVRSGEPDSADAVDRESAAATNTTTSVTTVVGSEEVTTTTLAITSVPSPSPTTTAPPATVPSDTTPAAVQSPTGYVFTPKPTTGPNSIAPGGALTKHLAEDIAASFGFDGADVEGAIAAVELPPEAGGNPEGWLAPGTYPDATSAADLIQAMVDRRVDQLEERGVPRDQWQTVLTAASVIEKETYNQNEKPQVARVLANRLAGGGPLQMDSIILYPVAEDRIFTTSEERSADSPYNPYRFDGLPPTPIAAPDEASIDAFLAPPPGDWWFYVTIDLDSGETRYAVTYDEHLDNVDLLRDWLDDNPTP